jgi:ATP-dependent helicase/DNAse subunit B
VNVILGPAKSGKTGRALARYAAALDQWRGAPGGKTHVWIGPAPTALEAVRDRLAALPDGGWLNPRIVTFATLAQEIVAQGSRRVRSISTLEKQRILAHAIERLNQEKQLKHFAAVADTPGFLRQVAAAIADLKRRDIWAEEVRQRSRTPRDHDFALIYLTYQEHLHRHQLYDAEGRFWAARETLEASLSHPASLPHPANLPHPASFPHPASLPRKRGEFPYGLIILDGFADFTAAQHDLLHLLAKHCQEILITLPAESESKGRALLFDKPRRTLEQLKKTFPQLRSETIQETHFESVSLATAEKNIFRDDFASAPPWNSGEGAGEEREKGSQDGSSSIAIVAANSAQGEIREIARRVKELLLSGVHPDEVAVIFPSAEELAPRINEVFADFGLPLALESRARLNTTPLVRAITTLLRLAVEDWPFELLLDVVGNQSISFPFSEGDVRAATERCIRRAQLPAGREVLIAQLDEWAAFLPEDADSEVPPTRVRLVQETQLALDRLSELNKALVNLDTPAPLATWFANLEGLLNQTRVITADNLPVWQLLKKQFVSILKIDRDFAAEARNYRPTEFLDLVERVAAETFLPSTGDPVGRVRVMSAEQARNLAVQHLFLAGLSEQSYSSAEGPGSLYREVEIQHFADPGSLANLSEQQTGEAMLLFYDMLTRASRSLTLSYPALDDKGQALTPSPYLTELERCFPRATLPTTVISIGGRVDTASAPLSRSDWRTAGMVAALAGQHQWLAGFMQSGPTRQLGRAILRSVESVASRSQRENFGPYEGLLVGEAARANIARRFGSEHLWSPSQLEKYATCPYQFFARQVLGLEPLEGIALRSDHLRKGHLLHQVLAAIHSQVGAGSSLDDKQLVERFTLALEQAIEKVPLKGLEDALREIERREIFSWAPLYSEQELAYRQRWPQLDEPLAPAHFEVRFGPKARSGTSESDAVSVEVPFTLDLGTEQIKLTGQIDRVDMGCVGGVTVFNIIDYKSGKEVKLSDAEMIAGRQLQLPLYALAAEQLLFAERKAVALATGYWSIQAGGFAPGRNTLLEIRTLQDEGMADSPRWDELNVAIKKRVGEIVHGVRSAQFPVYSEQADCTRYCDFSKICRIAQIRSLEKVWIAES